MNETNLTNARLVGILRGLNDNIGARLLTKQLPAKLLYALNRSVPKVSEAYEAYNKSLLDLCKAYGVTPDTRGEVDQERKADLDKELAELLAQETTVALHTVSPDVLERCGEGVYEALTYGEVERLAWLVEE